MGVSTILVIQGKDLVNTDPDKATNAYEGMGPVLELLEQIHGAASLDNIPAGRKSLPSTNNKEFKFKKRGKIRKKETKEIQREYKTFFSGIA